MTRAISTAKTSSRKAFTLVELMVVIGILLALATLALTIFNTGKSSDRMRSGARIAQSAFLGAKDRALHAKDLRGVRLTRDQTNSNLVNGFVYLRALDIKPYPLGSVQLERADNNSDGKADSADVTILRGFDSASPSNSPYPTGLLNSDWANISSIGMFAYPPKVRIPAGTGQWYVFSVNTSGPYNLAKGNECLVLQTPYVGNAQYPYVAATQLPIVANDVTQATSAVDIQLGNDVMPFHQPITLPSSCVIDLFYSSANVQSLAGGVNPPPSPATNIDIMFSPRGMIAGPLSAQGPLHFLIRDLQDATSGANPWAVGSSASANPDTSRGDRLILTIFPQTGLIQTFQVNLTDVVINSTGAAGSDGLADNPLSFAQTGQSAGQ